MTNGWQELPLGALLIRIKNKVLIQDSKRYRRLTIHTNNRGISVRDELDGYQIGTKRQFIVHSGQFLLSKIDAMNGAFGIVPKHVEKAIITSNFWAYDVDEERLLPKFFDYLTQTQTFRKFCILASSGTTHRKYLQEDKFLGKTIPLPSSDEQSRIVAHIDAIATRITTTSHLWTQQYVGVRGLMLSVFNEITANVRWLRMREVAPIIRRPVTIDVTTDYPELGIRSFGKATFHKPSINGAELGTKRLFRIEPNDLIFNNVFAWEGAVAVAKQEDQGRFGSHRFITCLPKEKVATSDFLCFYFSTREGLEKLGIASPGGAGRNRTLGLEALGNIVVPIPDYERQLWFDNLQKQVASLRQLQAETQKELDALLPSVLDKAFKGEL